MSMFSITSRSSTPRRCETASNGYRFTQTRSIGSISWSLSVSTWSVSERIASSPAKMRGLSVLTRPSSISGKPV